MVIEEILVTAQKRSQSIYVDGVYRARQSSASNDLVDLERVEVLKSTQGTLFGKNTASETVQFLTVAPQMDELSGFVELSGGNIGYGNFNGAINIPLVEGRVAARLSGAVTQRDGYVDNLTTGEELNERDRYSLRGQLLIEPSDALYIRLIADYIAGAYCFDQELENDAILQLGADANLLLVGGATTGDLLGGMAGCAFFGISDICDDPAFPEGGQGIWKKTKIWMYSSSRASSPQSGLPLRRSRLL